jgi:hypothetical protein
MTLAEELKNKSKQIEQNEKTFFNEIKDEISYAHKNGNVKYTIDLGVFEKKMRSNYLVDESDPFNKLYRLGDLFNKTRVLLEKEGFQTKVFPREDCFLLTLEVNWS